MGGTRKFELQYHNGKPVVLEEGTPVLSYELKEDTVSHVERNGTSRLTLDILTYSMAKNMPILRTRNLSSGEVLEIISLEGLRRVVVSD